MFGEQNVIFINVRTVFVINRNMNKFHVKILFIMKMFWYIPYESISNLFLKQKISISYKSMVLITFLYRKYIPVIRAYQLIVIDVEHKQFHGKKQ